jgi:hypothetical protein
MEFIRKTTVMSILPADVRADNDASVDFATYQLHGLAKFHLNAEAQGGSKELTVKLQESAPIAKGAEYDEDTSLGDTQLRSGVETNIKLGARFTQSGNRQVKKVTLRLKHRGEIAAGKWVKVSLYDEDTDAPNNLLGTSGTVLCSSIGDEYADVEFVFDKPVDLANTEDYFVVLEGDYDAGGTNNIAWQTDTIAEGGNYIHFTDAWQAGTGTKSLIFAVYEYNFTDISGGTFTKVENAVATEEVTINIDNVKAYFRAATTGADGANAGATCLVMIGTRKYPA